MSRSFNFNASSYTSYSSTSTSSNGQTKSWSQAHQYSSNPSGTTVRTTSRNHGEPAIEETRRYDAQGRELIEGGAGNTTSSQGRIQDVEVEDVTDQETDADKQYRENMEDEYAKREGGA